MFPTTTPSNTGAGLTTQDSLNASKLWKKGADKFEESEDVFQSMEGGESALIQVETDLSKGEGQQIYFRVKSGFYGTGKRTGEYFTAENDFEPIHMKTNSLTVGIIRNATRTDMMMEEELGMRGELEGGVNEELGKWMGREKTRQMGLSLLHQVSNSNHMYCGGRSSVDGLVSGDELSPDDLIVAGAMLEGMGGKPAYMGKDPLGNDIHSLMFLTSQYGSMSIEMDPETKANNRAAAGANGYNNRLFQGGLIDVAGHKVKKWRVIDHDGVGPIGSFLNPKAYLGIACVTGTSADLTGGGRGITGGGDATSAAARSSGIRFFVDFPRLAYTFCNGDTISATASTHQLNADNKFYVVIVNPSTSDVDASIRGKWGMCRISANDGNELTPDLKLGAAISGIAHTTVGGVTYDAALNTDVHPSGSLVYLANQYGKPLFRTVGLAKRATRRGYGKFRNLRLTDKQEGGYIREVYIASIFGQKPVADRRDRFPGVIVLHHTGKYPGWNHP